MTGSPEGRPRTGRPADTDAARDLVGEALGGTPYLARMLELLQDAGPTGPECRSLVMEREGAIAALALYGPVAGAKDVWRIHGIFIAAPQPPRDLGDAMLTAVLGRVRAQRARLLVAELPADEAFGDMLSLLRANDFDEVGRIPDLYRDGVALLFLARDVSGA